MNAELMNKPLAALESLPLGEFTTTEVRIEVSGAENKKFVLPVNCDKMLE